MQALKQIFLFCNLDQAAGLLMNPGHWSLWWRSRAGFRAHRQSCGSSLSGRRPSCRCIGFRPWLPWPTYGFSLPWNRPWCIQDQCLSPSAELLKEFWPDAPLKPTVRFGKTLPHLPCSMGKALQQPRWQAYKRRRRETRCCPWRGGLYFPKWTTIFPSYDRVFFRKKKMRHARCLFFFSVFLRSAPVTRVFFGGLAGQNSSIWLSMKI